MKKLVLFLPIFILLFTSCSLDNEQGSQVETAQVNKLSIKTVTITFEEGSNDVIKNELLSAFNILNRQQTGENTEVWTITTTESNNFITEFIGFNEGVANVRCYDEDDYQEEVSGEDSEDDDDDEVTRSNEDSEDDDDDEVTRSNEDSEDDDDDEVTRSNEDSEDDDDDEVTRSNEDSEDDDDDEVTRSNEDSEDDDDDEVTRSNEDSEDDGDDEVTRSNEDSEDDEDDEVTRSVMEQNLALSKEGKNKIGVKKNIK